MLSSRVVGRGASVSAGQCIATRCAQPRRAALAVTCAVKQDVLLRSLSDTGEVAVLVVDATELVAEACTRHGTAPTASAALGRALIGALLIGSFKEEDDVTQISFRGDGPIGAVMAIADARGNVKGRVDNVLADPPLREDGKLNVGAAVGRGILAVVRSHPKDPKPYTGMVPIVSGEIAEDLASYLVESEQTNSAIGLGVSINRDCSIQAAGGFLVQVLPFCTEETLTTLEANLAAMGSVTTLLNDGLSAADISDRILAGLTGELPPDVVVVTPKYGPCEKEHLQERMIRAVASLGEAEVRDIQATEGKIEVCCEFCNEKYQFTEDEVLAYRRA
ncbi:hypothetical protein FOA52_014211 [Chlamydomonas sp. UWO 241]|nr:hypothetical protein FOA52_014211 [Chlamydomonas sp. UWO 241]